MLYKFRTLHLLIWSISVPAQPTLAFSYFFFIFIWCRPVDKDVLGELTPRKTSLCENDVKLISMCKFLLGGPFPRQVKIFWQWAWFDVPVKLAYSNKQNCFFHDGECNLLWQIYFRITKVGEKTPKVNLDKTLERIDSVLCLFFFFFTSNLSFNIFVKSLRAQSWKNWTSLAQGHILGEIKTMSRLTPKCRNASFTWK